MDILSDVAPVKDKVAPNEWHYYYIPVYGQNSLQVQVLEETSRTERGGVFVYARRSVPPTFTHFDYASASHRILLSSRFSALSSATDLHTIMIPTASGNWSIGVTGSTAMTPS